MKERLLEMLACPDDEGNLSLEIEKEENQRIKEGQLRCTICGKGYPICNFIPRFVKSDNYTTSFSWEWHKFKKIQLDTYSGKNISAETFRKKTGFNQFDIENRLVLDVGVGAGRFAEVASRWNGEVVGVDLSFAVDAAYQNLKDRENVHFVQADIFKLPFKKEIFDVIFSIGVLHHTPSTYEAFNKLVPLLKENGQLAIWVYSAYKGSYKASDMIRRLTTKLPLKVVHYLSTIAIPLYYLYKIPFLKPFLIPISTHPNWRWRWLDTFDWYTPTYQWKHTYPEVYHWFKKAGFKEIELLSTQVAIKGKK